MQMSGDRQSALLPHDVLHALVVLSQTNGPQLDVDTIWQFPPPSQVRAGVSVDPEHVAGTHVVPEAYSRQPPAPLHDPSVPQVVAPLSVHWFSGSAPIGTGVQVPRFPVSAHD
jgi:hypothetical protein